MSPCAIVDIQGVTGMNSSGGPHNQARAAARAKAYEGCATTGPGAGRAAAGTASAHSAWTQIERRLRSGGERPLSRDRIQAHPLGGAGRYARASPMVERRRRTVSWVA